MTVWDAPVPVPAVGGQASIVGSEEYGSAPAGGSREGGPQAGFPNRAGLNGYQGSFEARPGGGGSGDFPGGRGSGPVPSGRMSRTARSKKK